MSGLLMRTRAAVGASKAMSVERAGADAAAHALAALEGRAPSLGLVFATARYPQEELLRAVRATVGPECQLAGCSGEGVISGANSDETDRAVAVLLITSTSIRFDALLVEGYAEDPAGAGRRLVQAVRDTGVAAPAGLWIFADGLLGNCAELLSEVHRGLPGVPVVGGAAGDSLEFVRTFQYGNRSVISGGISAVVISGDADVRVAVSHGCTPLGLPRRVTSADNGWVYEIDGVPAWTVFKEYLEGDPQDLNADGIVHLCIGEELKDTPGEYIIHTPLRLDNERGALFFPGGGLVSGQEVRMTRRDPDRIVEGAKLCGDLLTRADQRPAFVLQLDCAGRGRVLFGSCAADFIVKPIQERLGDSVPWIGFHTYGEIAPIRPGHEPRYHNYTVALCAVFDRP